MALLLGEDGRGYDLARRLEASGAWRAWLGDAAYAAFAHSLASPTAWEAFMTSRSQIPLQLRARALLFDKASAALFLRPPSSAEINPNFLQLHGDDVYFSLEDFHYGGQHQVGVFHVPLRQRFNLWSQSRSAFSPSKANEHSYERASSAGLRYSESDNTNTLQRHMHDELPDSWYNQFAEKYRASNQKFVHGDKESNKRTPEGMSAYLELCETHKRKRHAFKEEHVMDNGSSMHSRIATDGNSVEEDKLFFPELMFPSSCVPGSALPSKDELEENQKVEVSGVLDNLPAVMSPSPAMIERFGIIPEYVKIGNKYRGKDRSGENKRPLSQEQAVQMTNKVLARGLVTLGFEGGTETSTEIFSEIVGSHICKLGRILKLLTDGYRKQFSSIEVLKMFLQTTGYSNIGVLSEVTKNVNKGFTGKAQQHMRALQSQQSNLPLQAQQFQRPMNMLQVQNMTFQQQQQWEKSRRRQVSTPRGSAMVMDKDQPMVEVKIENMMESPPMDSTFSNLSRQQQQFRQQQMAMVNSHAQAGQQFKQLPPVQIPQLQASNTYGIRTPPVKVEAFHELVSGDSTIKHEPEHNKLTSPPK